MARCADNVEKRTSETLNVKFLHMRTPIADPVIAGVDPAHMNETTGTGIGMTSTEMTGIGNTAAVAAGIGSALAGTPGKEKEGMEETVD